VADVAAWLERTRLGVLLPTASDPVVRSITRFATSATGLEVGLLEPVDADVIRRVHDRRDSDGGRPAIRLSAAVRDIADLRSLVEVVDDVILPAWRIPDLETAADEARAEAAEAGRDPASLGVAALLPVSIGRTSAEASARADRDPLFARLGHPSEIGIFGTLEDCQDRVIALAHAGVTDLRCILPGSPDVPDVIAQLTAMTLGTTDVLVPGSLRSPAPPPPVGWGGRPDVPPKPGVSGGSRRR
jgi:hypothetical protein